MTMRTLLLAAVLALVARVPHAETATGVTITGKAYAVTKGAKVHVDGGVFVWLVDLDHKSASTTQWPNASIQQINTSFQPHVSVIPKGTVVGFPNAASIAHNVFSPDPYFDLGTYGKGKSATEKFNVATPVGKEIQIYCDIHKCMWARLKVVDVIRSDFIQAVDDKTTAYHFDNVPPGKYKVWAWAVASKEVSSEVLVVTNQSVAVPELHVQLGQLDTDH
jgi:plastocyanin